MNLKISYESDGRPVTDAEITINDKLIQHKGDGEYSGSIPNWMPTKTTETSVQVPGFTSNTFIDRQNGIGNIILFGGLAIIVASIILYKVIRTRNKRPEQKIEVDLS
jgi:hypothetical protein